MSNRRKLENQVVKAISELDRWWAMLRDNYQDQVTSLGDRFLAHARKNGALTDLELTEYDEYLARFCVLVVQAQLILHDVLREHDNVLRDNPD